MWDWSLLGTAPYRKKAAEIMAALSGRTIALPETRELDRLAQLLAEEGATTLRCPLVAIKDAPDQRPIETWLRALAAGGMDDLVFLTGEGLRRLLDAADRIGLRAEVIAALGRARKITRGPKPARALKEIGLASDLPAAVPTSAGVIDELRTLDLGGRRVGVQLYGEEPNRPLVDFLTGAGAQVLTVAPYVYASKSDDAAVKDLIDALAEARVDAITFTSAAQVDRLWQVAADSGSEARLRDGLQRVRVASIGPIVDGALTAHGVRIDIMPEKSFVMRRLVDAIAAALGPRA
jgi:uroporphyrinogen-III synthase